MDLQSKIEQALAEIRPYLQRDGGDIELVEVAENVATIKWKGYCASCAKNLMTLNGVKEVIKKYAPEVQEVLEV
jgi:Fe-S cluster biogenesis protein NfuA